MSDVTKHGDAFFTNEMVDNILVSRDGFCDAAVNIYAKGHDLADPLPTRGPEGFVVVVTGPAMGRWRAGRKFGPEPVSIPTPDLTEAEMEALASDPELTCQISSVDPNY